MKKSTLLLYTLAAGVILISLLSGCASITSFFKGSGKKYDAALAQWEEGKFGDSMYDMILLLQDDPNYGKAKEFVKANFQTAMDKTKELITAKESQESDPIEKSYELYKLYQDLYLMVKYAREIVPLTGPKDAWVWEPDLSKDYVEEFEGSRKSAVEIRMVKVKELFDADNAEEARALVNDTMRIFLYEDKWDTEAETALRQETAVNIASMAKEAAEKVLASDDTEILKDGLKTLDMALKYHPDDQDVAAIRGQIEDKLVEAIIAEGKALEAAGDLESLKGALKTYKNAQRSYSGSSKLQKAIDDVNVSIGEAYYKLGYEMEQKGDEASLKEALELYEAGQGYVEGLATFNKLEGAKQRSREAIAEIYYQKALALEKGVGKDIQKGKEVIALFETAREWVEQYKDSEERIAAINQAISVSIYVLAQQGDIFRTFENNLYRSVSGKLGEGFFVHSATGGSSGFAPGMINDDAYMGMARSKGINYMVLLTGSAGSAEERTSEARKEVKIDYQMKRDGTIEKLPDGGLVALNIGKDAYKGSDEDYLKSMDLRGYGTAALTLVEETREIFREFYLDYRVMNVETASTVYTGNWKQTFTWSKETILSAVEGGNQALTEWYKKENNKAPTSYTKNPPSEAQWNNFFSENADFVNNKAGAIAEAIKSDRF